MIIFSPNMKYTMQRLSDHVSNGAYFYFSFEYDARNKLIHDLLEKFTVRYHLNLTARQRNYRLETGRPICTLIIQRQVFDRDKWLIYLLFTTPTTRDFNTYNGVDVEKLVRTSDKEKIIALKKRYVNFKWDVETVQKELEVIGTYFQDNEAKMFVLKNSIIVEPTKFLTLELYRDPHKIYRKDHFKDGKEYKDHIRSYTWTWRYTRKTTERLKKKFIDTINRLVSQNTASALDKNRKNLRSLFLMLETWSVFKGNRRQAGMIVHFAHRFLQRRAKKTWKQLELSPPHLTYLPRLAVYADTIDEYNDRRNIFDKHGTEIPLNLVKEYYLEYDIEKIRSFIKQQNELREKTNLLSQRRNDAYLENIFSGKS